MCGIAGKLSLDAGAPVDRALLDRMIRSLQHRGPADAGVWAGDGVGLVNRRLKVIDLSDRAHQPMTNDDGSLVITYNGEVYNFQELRADLEQKGHRFRSASDTEVILRLYQQHGEACVRHLRGMFAFAIWDARRRRLFAARDRLGKKPFCYYHDSRAFWFASEPKAILQDPDVPCEADPEAIHHYLTFGYVPAPWSAFRGLRKLPPAHSLVLENGKIRLERYWALHYAPKRTDPEEVLAEELLGRLREVIHLRLIADVPVGILLSGGLDSSTIVAIASTLAPGRLRTFSIGFAEPEYNELDYAREVARRFDTEHHELIVRPDAVSLLPKLVWHYGEPFADSSAIPTFCLAELARGSVTVALAGDGGDEVFLGYERYLAARLAGRYDWLPAGVRRVVSGLAAVLPGGSGRSNATRLRRFAQALPLGPIVRYGQWLGVFSDGQKARLYEPAYSARLDAAASLSLLETRYRSSDAADVAEALTHTDVETYLPDDLLVKVDIASMAVSLEVRSPLLDHQLVEFAAALPVDLKLRGLTQKYLLREVMRGVLPPAILKRRKMGFGVPIDRWFRHELRDMAYDVLLDRTSRERGLFRPAAVRAYLDAHVRGRAHHHARLWSLLMLELWHRTFIDARCPVRSEDALLPAVAPVPPS